MSVLFFGIGTYVKAEDVDKSMPAIVSYLLLGSETSFKILKTGQTKSYVDYDDGYYKKGITRSYSRSGNIVTDNATKLQWQDDEAAKTTFKGWEDAKTHCSSLMLDGYSDWRLPSVQELLNIIDLGKYNPAIDTTFQNTSSNDAYWSSTFIESNEPSAWGVYFNSGGGFTTIISSSHYVRCVRAGQ